PGGWLVAAITVSASSMRGLPPKRSLNLRLLSLAVPLVTSSRTSSPTLRQMVLAICSGATDWAAAASATVAELSSVTRTGISGACCWKKARTDSRDMDIGSLQGFGGWNVWWSRIRADSAGRHESTKTAPAPPSFAPMRHQNPSHRTHHPAGDCDRL